ncbi:hypothetical protein SESBI_34043 [Sesbania bispinosa]|nr:hypothetical protein SESBI_34043 [Sesbania bispinosa]
MDSGHRESLDDGENSGTLQEVSVKGFDFELEAKGQGNIREVIPNSKRNQVERPSEIPLIIRSQGISQPSRSHSQLEEGSSCASRRITFMNRS